MKYGGQTVLEMPAISFGLLHPLGKPDLFAAFAFDMDSRQSRKVWNHAKWQRTAALNGVSVFPQNGGKLPFAVRVLAL